MANYVSGLPLKFVKYPLTFWGAITLGEDDTGHDFKCFGATSGKYMLWDESADTLYLTGGANLQIGANDTGGDVTFYGATSGSYMKWDESEDDLLISAADIVFSGASGTHHINFDSATLSHTLIGCGSYSSPMDQSTTTGFASFCSTSDDADSWRYGMGIYMKATGSGTKLFPLGIQAEYNGTIGVDRMEGMQCIALLGGGGEAGRLLTLGGDATAGMYAGWFKVGANTSCVVDSGSRVAPLWIDNQMNCVCSGEEYSMFITCGGSKVDAVFGLETTSSGWSQLFYLDETMASAEPFVSTGCSVTVATVPYLKVLVNTTQYGIPLIAI